MPQIEIEPDDIQTYLHTHLVDICGDARVMVDRKDREYLAQDLYETGTLPLAIVRPNSVKQIQAVVQLANRLGVPILTRGGGMSYTTAFLHHGSAHVLLDTSDLNQVRDVNIEDGHVTVDAGCTWKTLYEAVAAQGYRPVFWGPFSGKTATVGGSIAQGTANFGSGKVATSASAVLGVEIVSGTGTLVDIGPHSQPEHSAFFRPYGPDLVGLLTADAGALGIKTAVTLALEPIPDIVDGVSFSFETFADAKKALRDICQSGLSTEIIAMDAITASAQAGPPDLKKDIQSFWNILKSSRNPLDGLIRGAQIAIAGRGVFERSKYTAHFFVEGATRGICDASLKRVRRLAKQYGKEIPNAVISVIRADPFPDLPVTHFDGRRMLPIHGILPWSKAEAFVEAYTKYIMVKRAKMEAHSVTVADIFNGLGRNGLLFEPVFYWPDSHSEYHRRRTPEAMREGAKESADNPEARALVETLKADLIDMFYEYGAVHMQIGRLYPFTRGRDTAPDMQLLRTIKEKLDPNYIINPGVLGLDKGTK